MFTSDVHELLCLRVCFGKYFESSSKWVFPEKSQHRLFMDAKGPCGKGQCLCSRLWKRLHTKRFQISSLFPWIVRLLVKSFNSGACSCCFRTETSCTDSTWATRLKSWSDSTRGESWRAPCKQSRAAWRWIPCVVLTSIPVSDSDTLISWLDYLTRLLRLILLLWVLPSSTPPPSTHVSWPFLSAQLQWGRPRSAWTSGPTKMLASRRFRKSSTRSTTSPHYKTPRSTRMSSFRCWGTTSCMLCCR